ncbi:hypothetical protein [Rathayibacter sp. AY1C6]|uniref:hypothetical protein n=1 Tax=Rathayibacter sp. AY1C6 TaxID=2080539 RepID=UPI0011AFE652|nr:hypothetical protein [Rathayibacter sp. AY1C6]
MKRSLLKSALTLSVVAFIATGCTSTPQAEPMATQAAEAPATASVAPTTQAATEAAIGTRQNPVPVGQVLPFAEGSAFKVGASAETQVAPGYSVLPLVVQIDWENSNKQATAQGQAAGGPLALWPNIQASFVSAAGKSYSTMDDYTVDIENKPYDIGDVYEGTDVVNVNVPVSVPETEVAGGAWVIENTSSGARVFVAAR